jgi:hypothetical protein
MGLGSTDSPFVGEGRAEQEEGWERRHSLAVLYLVQ